MLGGVLGAVQGLTGIATGIIGSGKRKREQRAAQDEFNRRKAQFENLDTSNVFAGLENVYEDATVNQQQAEFTKRQQQQQLAQTMGGMQGAAGGSGIAALAQAMANQSSLNAERAGVSIGMQERQNQMAQMQQAANLQKMEAIGEQKSREAELNKISTLMGMSGQRLQAANQARNDATQAIFKGVGSTLAGVGSTVPGLMSPN
jgi:hypothetical protein